MYLCITYIYIYIYTSPPLNLQLLACHLFEIVGPRADRPRPAQARWREMLPDRHRPPQCLPLTYIDSN